MVTITINAAAAATAVFRGVILGAPGSGKGTVSFRIIRQFNLNHISVGDKLRQHVAAGTGMCFENACSMMLFPRKRDRFLF
jgi:cytidylate kinase